MKAPGGLQKKTDQKRKTECPSFVFFAKRFLHRGCHSGFLLMAKTRPTSNCQPSPKAPPDLTPPAKAEFKRLVKALKANGRLARADQNLIVVAAETWAMYRNAAAEVAREGSVITFEHNGMTGISQHFKVWKESARLLRGLLNDLGLTPTSRNGVDGKTEEEELEF